MKTFHDIDVVDSDINKHVQDSTHQRVLYAGESSR